jgi:hypothetical protein
MRIRAPGTRQPLFPVLLLTLPVLGCGGGDPGDGGAGGDPEAGRPSAMGEASVYTSEDGVLVFTLPERWGGEVSVRETEPADLEWTPPAPDRVFQFLLQPRDPRFASENLFNLYVYDEDVWEGAAGALGDSIGTEVDRRDNRVYVLSVPWSNPFPEGSVDHGRFERFRMNADEIREALGG